MDSEVIQRAMELFMPHLRGVPIEERQEMWGLPWHAATYEVRAWYIQAAATLIASENIANAIAKLVSK